jgi:hypothetical protein
MSVSLSFSEDRDDKPAAFRPSVDIDLCAESPPKRARQESASSPPPPRGAASPPRAGAQQQADEESSASIDTSKFFVPLSKQGFNVLHRQGAGGSASRLPPGARPEPPPLTQLKKKGDWSKKKPAAKKAATKKTTEKKPRATKKKTTKKKKDDAEEVDDEDDEDEKKEPEGEKRAAQPAAAAARPVSSFFSAPKAAVPSLADIEPARTAFEHFALLKQREVDRSDAGASREEKEEIIRSFWESLNGAERSVYDKLAELDQRRFTAELRAASK